jgi:hypothetical protein
MRFGSHADATPAARMPLPQSAQADFVLLLQRLEPPGAMLAVPVRCWHSSADAGRFR